jgi:hypothetical protein
MIGRSDGRLGEPVPTGEPLDHVCPICEGEGGRYVECYCNGLGVITAAQAAGFAKDDPAPRWEPRPLSVVPEYTGRRCHDCAFKANSEERDAGGGTASALFDRLELGNEGGPFYCHQGMHHGAQGYVPRQRDKQGVPIGHPICAGWVREYERHINKPPTELRRQVLAALGDE